MSSPFRLRFNKTSLENLLTPARATRATYYDTEVLGLQLRVTDRGVKSFCEGLPVHCGIAPCGVAAYVKK